MEETVFPLPVFPYLVFHSCFSFTQFSILQFFRWHDVPFIHAVYSRPATWFQGLVLVYYYTGICDVTVTIKIYLVTQNWTSLRRSRVADQEKTACTDNNYA